MGFNKNNQMTVLEILNSPKKVIKQNLDFLAKDYLEKTGRKVCRTCPSDIQYMLLSLQSVYKMTQFKFKKPFVQYKNKKGDRTTISNASMTDEKAIEFLRTNPERIKLFSKFPSNWETLLIDGEPEETESEKEARLAAEAEATAAAEGGSPEPEETESEKEARLAAEAEALKEELLKLSLATLRERYPSVKARSIAEFVEEVLAL